MNTAITIRFLTPYVSSITRDQDFVHSPLPLDGALAHAAYWEALVAGEVAASPTGSQADPVIMRDYVTPILDTVFKTVPLGHPDLLNDHRIGEQVYAVSSGFPHVDGQMYIRQGARLISTASGNAMAPAFETQPIRKRVPLDRLRSLDLELVSERGVLRTSRPETGKGVLKSIDNRVMTWRVYEYVWLADLLGQQGQEQLAALLKILKFQGMGKKRTAGFGRLLDYEIFPLAEAYPHFRIERRLFAKEGQNLLLLRPLPYDAIMLAPGRVVMTNLVVESGCGYRPPYWSDRRVVVREGTHFRFLN